MQNPQTYRSLSDDSLVVCANEGDARAFSELVRRYYRTCSNVAYAILRDRHDAEDETQNAVWKAYQHITQFQSDAKFSTWLTRIVVNQCLMRLRSTRRTRLVPIDDATSADHRPVELPSTARSPEDEYAQAEVGAMLRREIARIPPLLRKVFELRDIRQLPMEEVAAQLGISVAAAKSRLLRARAELRERMRKHEGRMGPATLIA